MATAKKEHKTKRRLILSFPAHRIEEPVTYQLVKEYNILINILNADISHGKEGNLLLDMSGSRQDMDNALAYLSLNDIAVSPVKKNIILNDGSCVHCGACTSVCFSGALEMDKGERSLLFKPEYCIACELCITACPLQLFELHFGIH